MFKSAREQMLTIPNGHGFPDHHWVHSNCSLKVLRSGHMKRTQWEDSLRETFHITDPTGTTSRNKVLDSVRVILGLKKLLKWYKPYNCTFLFQSATSYHIVF